jgi:hypothetical protein
VRRAGQAMPNMREMRGSNGITVAVRF